MPETTRHAHGLLDTSALIELERLDRSKLPQELALLEVVPVAVAN